MDVLVSTVRDLATNPRRTRWLTPVMLAGEAALCGLIVWKVPYTEIDFTTYMAQVQRVVDGERDYRHITGPTGPLVYPALHVYIYTALYYLTDHGTDIVRGQLIFAALYLVTLALVVACYRRVGAPPWLLVPLALSKRMHSIFLLRLFNDCWACLALWAAIYLLQRRQWLAGAATWGLGLGIKMTLLLAAPAVGVTVLQACGLGRGLVAGLAVVVLHVGMAGPFVHQVPWAAAYVQRAFDLGRRFLFKWTVNWRFVGEDTFVSPHFAISLVLLHITLLLLVFQAKWMTPTASTVRDFIKRYTGASTQEERRRTADRVTPVFVMDAVLGSMVLGMLCARSLHYQFYAYLGWASPYLLWRAGGGPLWVAINWAVQEWGWLVYPSTDLSSAAVVGELAVQVVCALLAPPVDHISPPNTRSLAAGAG